MTDAATNSGRKNSVGEGLTASHMQKTIDAITAYWNFFIPAFPDGRTPAEVAMVEAPSWMRPLLAKYKEPLDKLATQISPADRVNEITGEILSELQKGTATPRTQAIKEIIKMMAKHGSSGRIEKRSSRRPVITPKSGSEKPFELPTVIIPFASLYKAANVKKVRRILREYSRLESHKQEGNYIVREEPDATSFAVYQWKLNIGVRLGTISFLPEGRLLVGSLTSTRRNALHKFLANLIKGDLTLLEDFRDVKLPPPS